MGHGTKLRRPTLRGNAQFDVKFHFWQDKEATVGSKSIRKSSSLNGDELHKVRTAINLQNVLGDIEDRCLEPVNVLPKQQLITECARRDLPTNGNKALLVERLKNAGVGIMQWENHQLPGKLYKVERQKRANNYTEDGLDAFNRSMQERLNFVYPEEQEMEV
ncbi:unnamed protein product [Owenia fusiformis]|uniref:SAP domain-containing protein n=1 Tax=Owenia fusiformis TaxID=6347 RepID=A0A8S4MU40_OWEFU|nr:unnamed protein product [Owenia fusiformis]